MYKTHLPDISELPIPDWAHGFFYWVPQKLLYFGSYRRPPVLWRPVVSLDQYGIWTVVLPATKKYKPDLFHVKAEDVFRKNMPAITPPDSYISYDKEWVYYRASHTIGVLPHEIRVQIANWLKAQN